MRILSLYLCIALLLIPILSHCQCIKSKYIWTVWKPIASSDTIAYGNLNVVGQNIGVTMKSNFTFSTTDVIFGYKAFKSFKDTIPNDTVPETTWSNTTSGTTTMCFSQTVSNPVLLFASLGSKSIASTLRFSVPYTLVFDGGGMTYNSNDSITGKEGYAIIKFKGSFSCVTIYSTTPEYYTNITWGLEPSPDDSIINTNKAPSICKGDSVTLRTNMGLGRKYQWTFDGNKIAGANDSTYMAKSAGQYRVFATYKNGCVDTSASLKVQINPSPTVAVGSNQTICPFKKTVIGSTNNVNNTYSWSSKPSGFSSSSSSPTVSPGVTTTYYLTETISSTGCSDTDSVVVKVVPLSTANAGKDASICLGDSATIGVSSADTNTYSWSSKPLGFSSVNATSRVNPSVTTTYYLTETFSATGCKNSDSVLIKVFNPPSANAGNNTSVCAGDSATIGATSSAGSIYSWSSRPLGFNSTSSACKVSPAVSTTYYLTETIAGPGCEKSDSVIVSVAPSPKINLNATKSICEGDSAIIGVPYDSNCIYSWYSLPSGFNSANSSCEIRPLISTMYYLTGLLSSTGCKKTDSEFVNVVPIPAAFTGTDLSICVGDTTSIGTVPDSSCIYSWSSKPSGFVSGNSSSKVNPKITTVYYLTETVSGIGCKKSDSVIINVNPPPVIDISGNNSICPGDSSIISAVIDSSVVYQWSSNPAGFISKSAANKVSPVLTTEYYITETISSTGCKSKDSVKIIVFGLPRIPFLQDKYLCLEDTDKITLYAPAGYKNFWLKSADSSTSIIANDTGYYFLMVINEKGCKILDSAHVLQRCPPLLYMPSAFTPNGDTLNDYFRPISNDVTGFEMQIYNRWGERIYTTDKLDPGWDGTFQNEKSPAGTYLYFVTYTGYSKTGEIVEKYLNGSFTLLR